MLPPHYWAVPATGQGTFQKTRLPWGPGRLHLGVRVPPDCRRTLDVLQHETLYRGRCGCHTRHRVLLHHIHFRVFRVVSVLVRESLKEWPS